MVLVLKILAFIFTIGSLIFVHELGHFLVAKWRGVKVDVFALGFPPRLWSKEVGGTVYTINLIPLGGYVKLKGAEDMISDSEDEPDSDSLAAKKPWEQILIYAAGVAMNVLLAVLVFYGCYLVGFQPILRNLDSRPGIISTQYVEVEGLGNGSAVEKQSIKAGDRIVSVDGVRTVTAYAVAGQISEATSAKMDSVAIVVSRDGKEHTAHVSLLGSRTSGNKTIPISLDLADKGNIKGNLVSSFTASVQSVLDIIWITILGLVSLFAQLFATFKLSNDVSGPVGIAVITGQVAELGFAALLQLVAALSLSLAVFNLLPLPVLDGGRILFAAIEQLTGREIPGKIKVNASLVSLALLLLFVAVVTVKDISRLIS